ncbi:MAG: 2-dehydropantoate 2-reductase N-terminal domain-containing protein, partial [Xanthobacteraceae bacterium]
MTNFQRISILGAGAWGTALANAVARPHRAVTLYDLDRAVVDEMAKKGTNATRLPGVRIMPDITPTASLSDAANAEVLLFVVPTQALRALAVELASFVREAVPVIACAKGIEQGTGKFVSQILAESIPSCRPAVLSGPSFAADVARGLPTAVTLAAGDESLALALAEAL